MKIKMLGTGVAIAVALLGTTVAAVAQEAAPPIHGEELMTQQKREQLQKRLHAATTEEERNRIRAEHRKNIQARAQERNVELPDVAAPGVASKIQAGERKAERVRGKDLMTEQERARHRAEIRAKGTAEEREQARKQKHEEMKKRAQERAVEIPERPQPQRREPGPRGTTQNGRESRK